MNMAERDVKDASGFAGKLNYAVMEVTNRCNLRCPHCASASGNARPDEMSLQEVRTVVSDLAALGCHTVALLGGEVLLRPDWFDIAMAIREKGMELSVITNGLVVTPEERAKLKKASPQVVAVSLDGATPESYKAIRGVDGFAKCRRLLDELVSDGFRQVSAITTFSSKNIGDVMLFADMFTDTPIVWQVQVVHRAGERFDDSLLLSVEQWRDYAKKIATLRAERRGRLTIGIMDDFGYFPLSREFKGACVSPWDGCPAGRYSVGIRANGDVLSCLSLGSEFVEDNVRRRSLVEIWRDPRMFSRFRNKSTCLTGRCAKCPKSAECRAGCSAAALSTTGTLTENAFCVRQMETEQIIKEMVL